MAFSNRPLNRLLLILIATLGVHSGIFASEPASSAKPRHSNIEILRDEWGIPHVFADSDVGAMYGLGQAVAEDRGFQMHYNLRMIQGRLAEILGDRPSERQGESALTHDRRMRTLGFTCVDASTIITGKSVVHPIRSAGQRRRGSEPPSTGPLGKDGQRLAHDDLEILGEWRAASSTAFAKGR